MLGEKFSFFFFQRNSTACVMVCIVFFHLQLKISVRDKLAAAFHFIQLSFYGTSGSVAIQLPGQNKI